MATSSILVFFLVRISISPKYSAKFRLFSKKTSEILSKKSLISYFCLICKENVRCTLFLSEQKRMGEPLSYQQIDCAVKNLYGKWDNISEYAIQVLKAALDSESLKELFMEQEHEEALSKQAVLQVQKYEGGKVKESNVDEIIQEALRKKRDDRDAK